jgi:CRP-like cAMP-binding protein
MNKAFSKEENILYSFLNTVYPLTELEFKPIAEILKKEKYKKGEIILNIGQVETKTSLLIKGFVHQYVVIERELFTIDFSLSGMGFNNFTSYVENSPSNQIQKAMKDAELFIIKKKELFQLYNKNKNIESVGRIMAEQVALRTIDIAMSLSSDKPEERVGKLLKQRPDLFQEVPQRYLANLLGISPESLSRIRARRKS